MRSVYKCAGNWIYIASLSFNRWIYAASISRLYYYFFFFFYNINFKEILVFLYISFDCWDPLLYSCQRYNKHIHLHRVAHREICISSSHRIMAEKRRRGSSATFFFFSFYFQCIYWKKKKSLNMSSLFMCCTLLCVCVCVLRFHCERGFVKNGLGYWFLDDVPDPLKRISIPPIASLSVHRRDFFSSGSNWTKRLERPERKEKKKLMERDKKDVRHPLHNPRGVIQKRHPRL
jgi:hypothetical protein